ncbi:MAG: hypothetical protein ACFFAH_13405 [Promethearchaeota archaeon]
MGIEDLTQLELFDGIMGLIYPAVGIIIGTIIGSKYAKLKRKELLYVGISLICVAISYLALGITFLTIVFFDFVLDDTIYIIIFIGFSAFGVLSFALAMTILLYPYSRKKIVLIYAVICISYEAYLLICLFTNPTLIATRISRMDIDVTPIVSLFTLFAILNALILIIPFIRRLLKSDNLRILWKGRFLLISVIVLVIATILVVISGTNMIIIIISRLLLVIRMFLSYLGWLLPERVAKWLIKENDLKSNITD